MKQLNSDVHANSGTVSKSGTADTNSCNPDSNQDTANAKTPTKSFIGKLHLTDNVLLKILGVIWIVDAFLQLQPKMFGTSFIQMVIAPNALGQPYLIKTVIEHMSNVLSTNVGLFNTMFVLVQFLIGVGILIKKTTKPALVLSFFWACGVWVFGEGLGGIFTGRASAFSGAPGAVLIYALIGFLLWPGKINPNFSNLIDKQKDNQHNEDNVFGYSAAANGRNLNLFKSFYIWSSVWMLFLILQLLPFNRTSNWMSSVIESNVAGQPNFLAKLLHSGANVFSNNGQLESVIMLIIFCLVAIGPWFSRRPQTYISIGIIFALFAWIFGQAFGGTLTGMGTDPNSGILIVLLGLCYLPFYKEQLEVPFIKLKIPTLKPYRLIAVVAAVALMASALIVLTPKESTALTTSTLSKTTASSSMGNMVMTGTSKKMNMDGMGGLYVTQTNWKYVGPPLPKVESDILTYSSNIQDKGHKMQTPNCTTAPTAQQMLGAVRYVQVTSEAVAKYQNLNVAVADGYFPITDPNYPVVHYLNFKYMNRQDIMNPNAVDSLVYAFTPYGPVLVAAMFLMPGKGKGPMPYGCLVQWHAHTNLCYSNTTGQIVGFLPCPPGTSYHGRTPFMTHVWLVPVKGGPLAIDPSDLEVVEAAIMAQEQGLAPVDKPIPSQYLTNPVS